MVKMRTTTKTLKDEVINNLKKRIACNNMVAFYQWFMKNKNMTKDDFFKIQKEVIQEELKLIEEKNEQKTNRKNKGNPL